MINYPGKMIIIRRFSEPSKLDTFPYGTQCRVEVHKNDEFDLYVQTNNEDENPKWVLIGNYKNTFPEDKIIYEIEHKSNIKY